MSKLFPSIIFLFVAAALASAACTDSDGGINYTVKGTASNSTTSLTDYCISSTTVQEYYCSSYTGGPSRYGYGTSCGSGFACSNGACVQAAPTPTPTPAPVTCSDSDSGIAIYVRGTTKLSNETAGFADYCSSSSTLIEYYCSGNYRGYSSTACANGCSVGVCLNTTTCSDSDSGIAIYVRGTTKLSNETAGFADYCLSSSSLLEYYCSGNYRYTSAHACAGGCSSGVCLNATSTPTPTPTPTPVPCSDSDGGQVYSTKGTTTNSSGASTDYCLNNDQLQEYYCDYLNRSTVFSVSCFYKGFNGGCSDGRCVNVATPTPTPIPCVDSDGGQVYSAKGTTSSSSGTSTDYCLNGQQLQEYYCNYNNLTTGFSVYCSDKGFSGGCSDGRCLTVSSTPTPVTCSDTDGGVSYFVRGSVSLSNESYISADYCSNQQVLIEYYCIGGSRATSSTTCANGCLNGVCLNYTSTPTATPSPTPLPTPTPTSSPTLAPNSTPAPTPTTSPTGTATPVPLNSISLRLRKGWNLVGIPFPDAVASGSCVLERQWFYDNPSKSYVKEVSSEVGRGKWLKAAADCDLTYSGNYLPEQTLKLYAGWNLVSVQNAGFVDPAGVQSDCQFSAGPWAYENGSYYKSHPLKPGFGYWIKVRSDCSASGRDASAITGRVVAGNALEKILGNILRVLGA